MMARKRNRKRDRRRARRLKRRPGLQTLDRPADDQVDEDDERAQYDDAMREMFPDENPYDPLTGWKD